MTATDRAIELAQAAAVAADDTLATDLVGLDVTGVTPISDVFLLATGRTERQVTAIAREIQDALHEVGAKPISREGLEEGRWVLLDFNEIVVHVFHEEERSYYGLERLWHDCPVIDLQLPAADAAVDGSAQDGTSH